MFDACEGGRREKERREGKEGQRKALGDAAGAPSSWYEHLTAICFSSSGRLFALFASKVPNDMLKELWGVGEG